MSQLERSTPSDRSFFLQERERLTREITADFDAVLSSTNQLVIKHEQVLSMTKEYGTIAELWESFYNLMREMGTTEVDVDQEMVDAGVGAAAGVGGAEQQGLRASGKGRAGH
ncbi:F-box domain-containing protein [Mycena kentingensis (nom. inval.)]|nr:F-box domain-containing protein [Mycena kentingensis (nom. inval.)]